MWSTTLYARTLTGVLCAAGSRIGARGRHDTGVAGLFFIVFILRGAGADPRFCTGDGWRQAGIGDEKR